ncbi:MAG: glycosyltransferase, partial [Bacteroidia bacterium]|nr:glycosyltransferase [Bacteroidia bacterium]
MKLLFVTSRVPWPLDKGDKLRAFHQLKDLSKKFEVYLFCINELPPDPKATEVLKKYCKEIHIVNMSKIRVLFNLVNAYFTGTPLQVGYFYNSGIQN